MLRRIFLLATIAVLASSFLADEIIPEMSHAVVPVTMLKQPTNSDMATKSTDFNHRAKALGTIALIKAQGGGTKECQAAATELKESVNDAVSDNNKELGDLSTGSDCPERGQTDVTDCKVELKAAEEDAKAAEEDVEAALRAPLTLPLEAVMECMSTDVCPQIETAKATLGRAQQTQVQKDAAVVARNDECSEFEKSAARQTTQCQCAAKKAHDEAWEAATSGAAERDKSWQTAEHLLCALNQDATCAIAPTPTINSITLAAGVVDAVCPAEPAEEGDQDADGYSWEGCYEKYITFAPQCDRHNINCWGENGCIFTSHGRPGEGKSTTPEDWAFKKETCLSACRSDAIEKGPMTYMTIWDGGGCGCTNCNLNPVSQIPGKLDGTDYVGGHGLLGTPGFVKGTHDADLKLCNANFNVWQLTDPAEGKQRTALQNTPPSSVVGSGICQPEGILVYDGNGDNNEATFQYRAENCAYACFTQKAPLKNGPWSDRGPALGYTVLKSGNRGRCYCQHQEFSSCTKRHENSARYNYIAYEFDQE